MGMKIAALLIVSVFFLSSIQPAIAQFEAPSSEETMRTIMIFIFGEELSEDQLTWGGFMQNLVFPFLALFVVMYGILSEIRIFRNFNVKLVLALIMAFVSGWGVLATMHGFLITNAWLGTLGFGLVMLLGIFFWAGSRISSGWFDLTGTRMFGGMEKREQQGNRLKELRAKQAMYYNTWQKLVAVGRVAEAENARKDFDAAKKEADEIEKDMYEWLRKPEKMG